MGILDSNADDLALAAGNARTLPPLKTAEPGMFKGFAGGSGQYYMRSMAEAGRSLSMAVASVPVAAQAAVDTFDSVFGLKGSDSRLDDSYFRWHDEHLGDAVDFWTPKPEEVGAAGQVVGSLAGGVVQFLANPALMIGTAQLGTSETLVRQGVDAGPALLAGDIAGIGAAVGMKIPVLGSSLAPRLAAGVAGNVAQGVAQAAGTKAVLQAADAPPEVVQQYDPWDVRNRSVDALMGLAFGAVGHASAPPKAHVELTPTQRDAINVMNQARHLEEASSPGRPATDADLSSTVERMKTAMGQTLRGEPVNVEGSAEHLPDPVKAAERTAIAQVVHDNLSVEPPIERPTIEPSPIVAEPGDTPASRPNAAAEGGAPPRFAENLMVPGEGFDPSTGEPKLISANEHVAAAHADAANTRATARNLMATAAECLLGNL